MLLGRDRAPPWFYLPPCCMVSVGTMLSSFWILCNNTWMQVPLGHAVVDGRLMPDDWWAITMGPIPTVTPRRRYSRAAEIPLPSRRLAPGLCATCATGLQARPASLEQAFLAVADGTVPTAA